MVSCPPCKQRCICQPSLVAGKDNANKSSEHSLHTDLRYWNTKRLYYKIMLTRMLNYTWGTHKAQLWCKWTVAYVPKDIRPMGILLEMRDNFGFILHTKLCLNIRPISMYLVNSEVFINAWNHKMHLFDPKCIVLWA